MNLPTFLIAALVAVVFLAIIFTGLRNRKLGKSSCGGNCGSCSGCCHASSCGSGTGHAALSSTK